MEEGTAPTRGSQARARGPRLPAARSQPTAPSLAAGPRAAGCGRGRTRGAGLPPTAARGPPARRAGKEAPCMGLGRRKCLVGPGRKRHTWRGARGGGQGAGRGRERARDGAGFRRRGPSRNAPPPPTPGPACPVPAGPATPPDPHLRPPSSLCRSHRNRGSRRPRGRGSSLARAPGPPSWSPAPPRAVSVTLGQTLGLGASDPLRGLWDNTRGCPLRTSRSGPGPQ